MKAKAAVFREKGVDLKIEEVEIDNPQPNEVLVKTVACGVCHSDLHFVKGSILGPVPTIPGHEPAGVVEAVGSAVRSVAVGDHVIACTSMFCGRCKQCQQGRPYLCMDRRACQRKKGDTPRISLDGKPLTQFADLSAFCEKMLVHESAVVKIDDDIPLDSASLVGCAVTTGVGAALNTAKVKPGSTVAVFGAGGGCRWGGGSSAPSERWIAPTIGLSRRPRMPTLCSARAWIVRRLASSDSTRRPRSHSAARPSRSRSAGLSVRTRGSSCVGFQRSP